MVAKVVVIQRLLPQESLRSLRSHGITAARRITRRETGCAAREAPLAREYWWMALSSPLVRNAASMRVVATRQ